MLTLSVGEALEMVPANVFKVTLSEFQLKSICGMPDLDDARYGSYELAISAIQKRQNRISAVTDSVLRAASIECIQSLEDSKDEIRKFYGQEKHRDQSR